MHRPAGAAPRLSLIIGQPSGATAHPENEPPCARTVFAVVQGAMPQTGHPLKYPSDLADAFFEREAQSHARLQEMFAKRGVPTRAPPPTPSRLVLSRLVEVMFFASMATEEGRVSPVGVVLAENLQPFGATSPAWDLVRFASPVSFEVAQVVKLASACAWPGAFLVVVPRNGTLEIVGIATPHSRSLLFGDQLVRVLARRPGVVAVRRGENEIVRYEQGALRVPMWLPIKARHRPQMSSIQRTVMHSHADRAIDVTAYLMRIEERMAELGHGGILAILAPSEPLKPPSITAPKKLKPPLNLGSAILDMYEAHMVDNDNDQRRLSLSGNTPVARPPTDTEARAKARASKATEVVERMLEQISRLTTVDGAVVMSHSLEVLAFGAKLSSSNAPIPKVYAATPGPRFDEEWPLNTHGTRHRAAAAFAAGNRGRLAFIVSQDGGSATFQLIDSKLVYWPRWTTLQG